MYALCSILTRRFVRIVLSRLHRFLLLILAFTDDLLAQSLLTPLVRGVVSGRHPLHLEVRGPLSI